MPTTTTPRKPRCRFSTNTTSVSSVLLTLPCPPRTPTPLTNGPSLTGYPNEAHSSISILISCASKQAPVKCATRQNSQAPCSPPINTSHHGQISTLPNYNRQIQLQLTHLLSSNKLPHAHISIHTSPTTRQNHQPTE